MITIKLGKLYFYYITTAKSNAHKILRSVAIYLQLLRINIIDSVFIKGANFTIPVSWTRLWV